MSSIVITLLGKSGLVALDFFGRLFIVCLALFALPLGVIGRLYSVIVVLPGHLLCYLYTSHLYPLHPLPPLPHPRKGWGWLG